MPQSVEVLLALVLVMGCGVLVGRISRLQGIAGLGVGFCVLATGANLALWFVYSLGLATWLLPLVSMLMTIGLAFVIRTLPWREEAQAPLWPDLRTLPLFATLLIVLVVGQRPVAMTNFFQPWDALWIGQSLAAGHFIVPAATTLGGGFMTSAMYYTWNLLGFVAAFSSLHLFAPFSVYLAVDVVAKLGFVALLAGLFRKLPASAVAFVGLLLLLIAFDPGTRRLIALHAHEEGLLLSSGIAIFALVRRGDIENRLLLAMVACCFFALARSYGAIYGAVIICAILPFYIRANCARTGKFPWRPVLIGIGLFATTIAHDVAILVAHTSPYFPRKQVVMFQSQSFLRAFWGVVSDTGLLQIWQSGHVTPSPKGIWILTLAGFLWTAAKRRLNLRDTDTALRYLVPLLFVATPIALSLSTGYRAYLTINKLFTVATPFFLVMPVIWGRAWYALAVVGGGGDDDDSAQRTWSGLMLAGTTALLVVVSGIYSAAPHFPKVKLFDRLGRSISPDREMAETLIRTHKGSALAALRARPVLYFYYEPGVGLRYYLGGNLFHDYDFWSTCALDVIRRSNSLEALFRALGGPNLYVSYSDPFVYGRLNGINISPTVRREVASLAQAPYIRDTYKNAEGGRFYEMRPGYFPARPVVCQP